MRLREIMEGAHRMKPSHFWLLISLFSFILFGCSYGRTFLLNVRYEPLRELPSLQQKMGPALGIAPLKDERKETLYIGLYTPNQGTSTYFKSDPSPLGKAIEESLSQAFSRHGLKTVAVPDWDGKPESLKGLPVDAILSMEIKGFWIEGTASFFRTRVKTSVHLLIHLGIKNEGKVYTRNVEVEKEMVVRRLTPQRAEQTISLVLADIFDAYFSNPY
jgi:hypothetical protein